MSQGDLPQGAALFSCAPILSMATVNGTSNGATNGFKALNRAEEVRDVRLCLGSRYQETDPASGIQLIDAVKSLIVPYIAGADARGQDEAHDSSPSNGHKWLAQAHRPEELVKRLNFALPEQEGHGKDGLLEAIQRILENSVNTWDQGFLDKLYSSTNAVRGESFPGRSPGC